MKSYKILEMVFVGCLIMLISNPNLKSYGQSDGEFCGPNNQCDGELICVTSDNFTIVENCGFFSFIFGCDQEKIFQLTCQVEGDSEIEEEEYIYCKEYPLSWSYCGHHYFLAWGLLIVVAIIVAIIIFA